MMAGTSYSSDNRIKGLFAENGYNREGDTSLPPGQFSQSCLPS